MVAVDSLVPVLQTAIGPVVLVSGVGLILLTMTNRFGRVIDRSRALAQVLREQTDGDLESIRAQLTIHAQRARLLRTAIALASLSVLFAAILIIALFVRALFDAEVAWLISLLFSICMACVVAALVAFLIDVNRSLTALKLEIGDEWKA